MPQCPFAGDANDCHIIFIYRQVTHVLFSRSIGQNLNFSLSQSDFQNQLRNETEVNNHNNLYCIIKHISQLCSEK